MGSWLTGGSVDRQKKKELPRSSPAATGNIVLDSIARSVVAEHQAQTRAAATTFLDRFLRLFADYSHSSARSHKRKPPRPSNRTPAEIVGELKAFYARRPRPWRWHGGRS